MTLLSPYRVLDLTDDRGHLAGFILARLGADVVAVEPPGGSTVRRLGPFDAAGRSLTHASYARGKRSVELDLRTIDGAETMRGLIAGADVLLESGNVAGLTALGLGLEQLAELNPALITVSISAFGLTGPKADWAATDLTVWAAGGPLHLCGDEDRAPLQIGVPQAYLHAAGQAAGATMIALLERNDSGLGQHIDVSAQTVAMQSMQSSALCSLVGAPITVRAGGGVKGGEISLRWIYPAADGSVSITHAFGAAIGPATGRLMKVVHQAGFCDEATANKDWIDYAMALSDGREPLEEFERVKECVAAFTSSRTKDELFALALKHRLLLVPVATTEGVANSEQLAARNYWDGVGGDRFPGHWMKPEPSDGSLDRVPEVGEHTTEVLAEQRTPALRPTGGGAKERPLEGLKVVDFMWALAGPTVTRQLADAGATVIRVESKSRLDPCRTFLPFMKDEVGSENSALFNNVNAGKLGLTLDLNCQAGLEVAKDLVRWADVVCEAFSPRAMRNWGLEYEAVAELNPSVVMLSTSLLGQTGPLADFAGYGNIGGAMTGFYSLTGWPDRPAVGPFGAITDYTSPHLTLTSLLAAVDHQRRTGEGRYLDFSQAEASIHFITPALLDQLRNGRVVGGRGNTSNESCPHGVFRAAGDDRWVAVVAQDDRAWMALAGLIGRDDLATLSLAERLERRTELEDAVSAWTQELPEDEVELRCQTTGIAAHRVQNSVELAADPQLAHRGHWCEVEHSLHRRTTVEGPRFHMSRSVVEPRWAAPTLGEHTHEVLTEHLGYDPDQVADLAAQDAFG